MIELLLWTGANSLLTVNVHPPQSFSLRVLKGGNYGCLDVPQEDLGVSFQSSSDTRASADLSAHQGLLVTVLAKGETVTDCANVLLADGDQEVSLFLLTELQGDTVVLLHENEVTMNLFAEFQVGDEYCLASYLQPVCRSALYSSPADKVEMIQLQAVESDHYLWFLDGVASLYTDPDPLSGAKFVIKYFVQGK
jgi:hypothetical protein